jgi:stearoyl-CoA desaturase (delta-9 desaturase)
MDLTENSASLPAPADKLAAGKRTLVVSSPHIHRLQRRHFLLFDVMPFVAIPVAIAVAFIQPVTRVDIALLAVFWLATGLGLTVGFHRLFSHGAFATPPAVAAALAILGSMAARGSPISWATIHRRHHQFTDRAGDPHSPHIDGQSDRRGLRGWWHAHEGWLLQHDYPNPAAYAPDLLRQAVLIRVNRHYYRWIALGLLAPALIGGLCSGGLIGAFTGFLWGGALRIFLVGQTMSTINSLLHMAGSKPYRSADGSRNIAVLSLALWGEAWHNNHHAFPYSAAFGLRWYELDPGYWLICALQLLGLATKVRIPDADDIAARRLNGPSGPQASSDR